LDEELRINCIRDVEETFEENEEAYQFVRQRFLSRLLPEEADIKNAIKYAKTQKVKQLYQEAEKKEELQKLLHQKIMQALTNKTKSADKCSKQVKINIVNKGK